jgi:excisionase family DNA binding protein
MTISVESDLLTPAEVATLFRVSPKTVTRWARSGKLTALRTLGGHRRFRAAEVKDLLERFEEVGTDLG